jgi:hypothetical protein
MFRSTEAIDGICLLMMKSFTIFQVSRGNQNRAQFGGGMLLNGRLLFDVYFLQQNMPRPRETLVLGSTLRVDLTATKQQRMERPGRTHPGQ